MASAAETSALIIAHDAAVMLAIVPQDDPVAALDIRYMRFFMIKQCFSLFTDQLDLLSMTLMWLIGQSMILNPRNPRKKILSLFLSGTVLCLLE